CRPRFPDPADCPEYAAGQARLRVRQHEHAADLADRGQRHRGLGPRHRDELPDPPADARAAVNEAMYALNFYSPIVAEQLRSRRKTATIRLGNKSGKYKKGMVVQVLVGARFGPRQRSFDAVIDKVDVKTLREPTPAWIEARCRAAR